MRNKGDDGGCADHADGYIKQVVAEGFFFLRGFAFDERFIVRTEDFAQQCHTCLR